MNHLTHKTQRLLYAALSKYIGTAGRSSICTRCSIRILSQTGRFMRQVRSCAFAFVSVAVAAISVIFTMAATAVAQRPASGPPANAAWNDKALSSDKRADMVMHEMTTAEKFQ